MRGGCQVELRRGQLKLDTSIAAALHRIPGSRVGTWVTYVLERLRLNFVLNRVGLRVATSPSLRAQARARHRLAAEGNAL
jgi:hypothetical protein